jgi:hypothetical protein
MTAATVFRAQTVSIRLEVWARLGLSNGQRVISPSPSFLYQLEKAKATLDNISSGVAM